MTTAGHVAIELRKLADSLDAQPDAEIIKPLIHFYGEAKEPFLSTAKLLPRPLKKRIEGGDEKYRRIHVEYDSSAMWIDLSVRQTLTCEILEPAKPAVYRCAPILSDEEEMAVGA
jgi:hypothetical protein